MTGSPDPRHFRRVLGHFPTGVVVVTSHDHNGGPLGMTVGSFTSVSLSPPLVAFLPGKQSRTAPKILRTGRFCVNVLGAHQEAECRSFAGGGDRKFDGIDWTPSPSGLPRLDGAVAWIECTVEVVHGAGDHDIVIGRVTSLDVASPSSPLLFHRGDYGSFAPLPPVAAEDGDFAEPLRLIDVARPVMADLAERNHVECLASGVVGGELVLLTAAGVPAGGRSYSRVGQRMPHIPPLGTALVAWSEQATRAWIARGGEAPPARRHDPLELADRVRARGWSVATWSDAMRRLESTVDKTTRNGLTPQGRKAVRTLVGQLGGEHEPDDLRDHHRIRSVSVPVFDGRRRVVMQLTVDGLPADAEPADVDRYVTQLRTAAGKISRALPADRMAVSSTGSERA